MVSSSSVPGLVLRFFRIEPITNRHVVYVAQGGELKIYDTTTDALQTHQVDIFGFASDVKLVDF
jgi:hypothetical protein